MNTLKYNEKEFEDIIERDLIGIDANQLNNLGLTKESFNQSPTTIYPNKGYIFGFSKDFNKEYAIDTFRLFHFLEHTQAKEIQNLQQFYPDWQNQILKKLHKDIATYGILQVFRNPFLVHNATFTLFYEAPAAAAAQSIVDNFQKNEFSITRQLYYSIANPHESIDAVLFLNGLPIVTLELKNQYTGQTAAIQGINQYKFNRSTSETLLKFGHCLVHFTLDADEVYMCTKLQGKDSIFLPFNKGFNFGKGNPPNPNGYNTDYLWKEVFQKHTLANIIQNFMVLDGKGKKLQDKFYIFPRYHQLDVVNKLVQHVQDNGIGQTYLIQHSAGSGKSNSIAWSALRLIELEQQNGNALFNSVIIVTDRRALDHQLAKTVNNTTKVKSLIGKANSSKELKAFLENGKRIITTTIQKFPFIVDEISNMASKNFAIIIDEAHSSQGGQAANKMNESLGIANDNEEQDTLDIQDLILQSIKARKMRSNASYFAFTATPKNTTLERFGQKDQEGLYKPFHLYSMKQAIEEGFILDVLSNYTVYNSYYNLYKSIEDNPLFNTKEAQKKLKAYVEKEPRTIQVKAKIMLDHFMQFVLAPKSLKGKAKAMVITQDIEAAIRYYQALKELLAEQGYPFKILIAFSGKKTIKGIEYTEAAINGFADTNTPQAFDQDEYRILVVANKYLTGFDQPKLTTMYVDKKLQGVLCVQALSRLNRAANSLNKTAKNLFILDFFNTLADIKASFDPFYTSTVLEEITDVNILHSLKAKIDEFAIYTQPQVQYFASLLYTAVPADKIKTAINPIVSNFKTDLDEEQRIEFKTSLKHFIKIYAQVAALLPYEQSDWDKHYWFYKHLLPDLKLEKPETHLTQDILNSIDLNTYGIELVKANANITLDQEQSILEPTNANPRSAHIEEEEADLETILQDFNARFGQILGNTPEESNTKLIQMAQQLKDTPEYSNKYQKIQDPDTKQAVFKQLFQDILFENRKRENTIYKKSKTDNEFLNALLYELGRVIDRL